MKALFAPCLVLAALSPAAHALDVSVGDSTAPWGAFMNVSELPENGGAFVFGDGWGIPDLNAAFDDGVGTVTLSPNTIGDANEFWYQNTSGTAADPTNPGGPGQRGNKSMEANLFISINPEIEEPAGSGTFIPNPEYTALEADGSLTFSGTVLSNSYTAAHVAEIFIKEFTPDFSSVVETAIPLAPGAFSITQAIVGTGGGLGGTVQYGFRTTGENVWAGDEGPFGSAVIAVPEPASLALLGAGGLALLGRRRRA